MSYAHLRTPVRPVTAGPSTNPSAPTAASSSQIGPSSPPPSLTPAQLAAAVSRAYPHTPTFSLAPRFKGDEIRRPATLPISEKHRRGRDGMIGGGTTIGYAREGSSSSNDASRSPSPSRRDAVVDDGPRGPRAEDYESMRVSLETIHARNLAAKALAQQKADASQEQFRLNQQAITEAAQNLEAGLEAVEDNFGQRLDEYESLLNNRTEVARSLNLQLRKRSKYAHGASSSEETVDSILDAISNWFVVRSGRALSDEPLLAEVESESAATLRELSEAGGADGTVQKIFERIKFPAELQERLMARLRETTSHEVVAEHEAALRNKQHLAEAREQLEEDQRNMKQMEDALSRAHSDRNKLLARLDGGELPASSPTAGKKGGSGAPASRAELEGLLKKKLKQIGEMEKRRAKLAAQVHAQAKQGLEKDRQVESLAQQVTKLTLALSSKDAAAASSSSSSSDKQSSSHRDALARQLLLRSSQQAEEHGALKLFVAHTLAEREEQLVQGYARERDAQIQRIREAFERLVDPTTSSATPGSAASSPAHVDHLHPSHLSRVLASCGLFSEHTPADFATLAADIDATEVEPELLGYVARSGGMIATTGGTSVTASASKPAPHHVREESSVATLRIGFVKFLSFLLRHHPLERFCERHRLARRLRLVFDGLDHDRDGKLSIGELETAYRKEGIGVTKEQLDNVYLCITAPPPTSSSSGSLDLSHPDDASLADSLVARPLDFPHFLTLFPLPTLRTLFDAPAGSGAAPEENTARRRHERCILVHAARKAERLAMERERREQAQQAQQPPSSGLTPLKSRKPLKPLSSVPPAAVAPRSGADAKSSSASVTDELDRAAAQVDVEYLMSTGYFTQGTKDCLLHLLSFDPDSMTSSSAASTLTLDYLDPKYEALLRSGSSNSSNPAPTFVERAVQALCHPLVNVRAMLEIDALKKAAAATTTKPAVARKPSTESPGGLLKAPPSMQRRASLAVGTGSLLARPGGAAGPPQRKLSLFVGSSSGGGPAAAGPGGRRASIKLGPGSLINQSNSPRHAPAAPISPSQHGTPNESQQAEQDQKSSESETSPTAKLVISTDDAAASDAPSNYFMITPRPGAPSSGGGFPSARRASIRKENVFVPVGRHAPNASISVNVGVPVNQRAQQQKSPPPAHHAPPSSSKRSSHRSSLVVAPFSSSMTASEAAAERARLERREIELEEDAAEEAAQREAAAGGQTLDEESMAALTAHYIALAKAEREQTQKREQEQHEHAREERARKEREKEQARERTRVREVHREREREDSSSISPRKDVSAAAAAHDEPTASSRRRTNRRSMEEKEPDRERDYKRASKPIAVPGQPHAFLRRGSMLMPPKQPVTDDHSEKEASSSHSARNAKRATRDAASPQTHSPATRSPVVRSRRGSVSAAGHDDESHPGSHGPSPPSSRSPSRSPVMLPSRGSERHASAAGVPFALGTGVSRRDSAVQTEEVEQEERVVYVTRSPSPPPGPSASSLLAHRPVIVATPATTAPSSTFVEEEKDASAEIEAFRAAYLKRLLDPDAGSTTTTGGRPSSAFPPSAPPRGPVPSYSSARDEVVYAEGDAKTFHQLYETERARVAQLERTLRLLTLAPSASQASSAQQLAGRHVHASLGGSLTARHHAHARPISAAHGSPRGMYHAFTQPMNARGEPTTTNPYGELISRRSDGLRSKLLTTTPFMFGQPATPAMIAQPRPMSAFRG